MKAKLQKVRRMYSLFGLVAVGYICGIYTSYLLTSFQYFDVMGDKIKDGASARRGQPVEECGQIDYKKTEPRSCQAQNNFVFIKTEKSGGSTVSSTLFRYGMKHNLVAALKPEHVIGDVIRPEKASGRLGVLYYNCSSFPGFNYLCSHIQQYNRTQLDAVVPGAKYATIVRSPYTHLKSKFYYSRRNMNLTMSPDPFAIYLKKIGKIAKPSEQLVKETNSYHFRFGLEIDDNETAAYDAFRRLDEELDLVMIMEYIDESLVLLKKTLCWDVRDIVYQPCKVHTEYQPPITDDMRRIISKVSRADIQLYDYFNKTFWEKVKNYDGDFEADLAQFRSVQNYVKTQCEARPSIAYCRMLRLDVFRLTRRIYTEQMKWMC